MIACRRPSKAPSSSKPTDIVTYRYSGGLVYVPAAPNYVQALSHARDAFPQLKDLPDASLSLSLATPGGHARKFVGISAPAWPKLVAHLARYQIIDVRATPAQCERVPIPDIVITYADGAEGENAREMAEPAPPYRASGAVDDEKASYSSPPPRSSSGPTLRSKRSWFFQKLHVQ